MKWKQSTIIKRRIKSLREWEGGASESMHRLATQRDEAQEAIVIMGQFNLLRSELELAKVKELKTIEILEGKDNRETKIGRLKELYKVKC